MKKSILFIASLAIAGAAIISCTKENKVKAISVSAVISEEELGDDLPKPESYEVTFTNTSTMQSVTVNSENGMAVVAGILPGLYTVSAYGSAVAGGYSYTYTGTAANVSFAADNEQVTIKVTAVKESALVFKEIYYSGCTVVPPSEEDSYGTMYFRDQFDEIYNNSSETVYADGLCFGITVFADYTFTTIYDYDIADKDKYIFMQVIWQIPGEGTTYPVKPGESFIIAQWATNHKADNLSKGKSPVDLSGVEFETFIKAGSVYGGITLTDEAAINLERVVDAAANPYLSNYLTSVSGACYILFKPSKPLVNSDFIVPTNVTPSMNNYAREVLISDVIDAVEAISDETRVSVLGLPNSLDAGYIWCNNTYSGESISRKIKETKEDGRIVYQDTNNTCNDFEVNTTPVIRRNGAKVPSWNTWNK